MSEPSIATAMEATPSSAGGATPISLLGLGIAAAPLLAVLAIGAHLRLDLNSDLAIGAVRCAAQLSAVGYVLGPVFNANHWLVSIPYILAMGCVAAIESVSRPKHAYPKMLQQVFLALGLTSAALVTLALSAIIPTQPAFDSRYLIPLMGMLLGSSCSAVAVGLSAALEDLSLGATKVEALLAMGASRTEATHHVIRRGVRMALIGQVNSLNVTGLVAIPGMMTGQILGGSDPSIAARYQTMILFLLAASTAFSATSTIYSATFTIVGARHSLQAELITSKTPSKDVLMLAVRGIGRAANQARDAVISGRLPWLRHRNLGERGFERVSQTQNDDPENNLELAQHDSAATKARPASRSPTVQSAGPQSMTFSVQQLYRRIGDRLLHSNIGFEIHSGEVLFITGPSGCGKTRLLRSLAALDEIESGDILLDGESADDFGFPTWRSSVGYGFQQSITFGDISGAETPAKLFDTAKQFGSQRGRSHGELQKIGKDMGLEAQFVNSAWKDLSGGQAQRAQLAVMVALRPRVLLLDEPTSACDNDSAMKVESVLKACGAALIWVSHDAHQPSRIGGRILTLVDGSVSDVPDT